MRHVLAILLSVALLAACERDSVPVSQSDAPRPEPLYVYSAYEDVDYLPALFREFTDETGILVVVRHRSDAENLDDMMAKAGSQPADLLLTSSVAAIWTAAEEGLLRPLPRDSAAASTPEAFRDPDGLWVSISADPVVVLRNENRDADVAYETLGRAVAPLCVSSSALDANRVLLAWMIAASGERAAELSARQWVTALEIEPREDHGDVIDALERGACNEALLPLSAVPAERRPDVIAPGEVFFDIEGIGIGRHARSPAAAAALIDWLLSRRIQERHAAATGRVSLVAPDDDAFPGVGRLSTRGIAAAGFLYADAVMLAERARYR